MNLRIFWSAILWGALVLAPFALAQNQTPPVNVLPPDQVPADQPAVPQFHPPQLGDGGDDGDGKPQRSDPVNPSAGPNQSRLEEVAVSPQYQWNGVALTKGGRRFAAFPRQLGDETISVAEIAADGSLKPFPDGAWNTFSPVKSSNNPETRFVNVNAILMDKSDNLWVVDAGTVKGMMVPGAPKLVKIDVASGRVERIYRFNDRVLPDGATLNDVRIGANAAYLTESGLGALIVVDLNSGESRRLLSGDPSTKADADPRNVVTIEGRKVLDEKGQPPKFNVNNLELTPDEKLLLYKPSFAYNWFRIPTAALLDTKLNPEAIAAFIERGPEAMPTGGTTMDDAGNIYLMDLERRAIWKQLPSGELQLLVRDPRLLWPDASAVGTDGYLYVPCSQNHRIPLYNRGVDDALRPWKLFRLKLP